MSLCLVHQAEAAAWLDYRARRPLRISSGAAYDETTAGVRDARRRAYCAWRDLVRGQLEAIEMACARGAACWEGRGAVR